MRRIYLDHNATTPLDGDVRAAMAPFFESLFGNPSSIHAEGRAARDAVERARAEVAMLLAAQPGEIVFTSGGTEANQLAIVGGALAARAADPTRVEVLASPLEHPSVGGALEALRARGFAIRLLAVDANGRLSAEAMALDPRCALLVVQLANHELGNLTPLAAIAARARAVGARVHADVVQAAGKLPIDVHALGLDSAALSAHKLHGPKGAGALFVAAGREPLAQEGAAGGHQERGRRPGTENVAGIVGLGAAAKLARQRGLAAAGELAALRDRLEAGLCALGATVNGDPAARVANTCNVAFDVPGDLVVQSLDLAGVACSTGAACTSGSPAPSPVLLALGQSEEQARRAVRFSLGRDNSAAEIDTVLTLLPPILERIRRA